VGLGQPRRHEEHSAVHRGSLAPDEQIHLNFALAKTFADIGDPERSFRCLLDGNLLKRKQTIYHETATLGQP
jgi:hypothetical protein